MASIPDPMMVFVRFNIEEVLEADILSKSKRLFGSVLKILME